MAGTNRQEAQPLEAGPVVILVEPQLGMNIGMVARAMLNCGLTELRLVCPRDGWPNPEAEAAAVGAVELLERAQVYQSTKDAVADLQQLYVTTARSREMVKPIVTPKMAAVEMRQIFARQEKAGLLFGPERTGLTNDDVALGDKIVNVPLNPGFSSLNLAQAVLLLGYEWFQAGLSEEALALARGMAGPLPEGAGAPASKEALNGFIDRLVEKLTEMRFFMPPEKKPGMVRNLQNIFARNNLTAQEVATLQGVLSALMGAKLRERGRQEAAPKTNEAKPRDSAEH